MDTDTFSRALADEGFTEVLTVTRAANGALDTHSHPFAAKALILSGEISIRTATADRTYQPGDVFQLAAHEPHTERYGPRGVSYLVGRR